MPLRLNRSGLSLISYDSTVEKWVAKRITELLPWWHCHLETTPDCSVRLLLDAVDLDPAAKHFLASSLWCNIDDVHEDLRSRKGQALIEIFDVGEPEPDGGCKMLNQRKVAADFATVYRSIELGQHVDGNIIELQLFYLGTNEADMLVQEEGQAFIDLPLRLRSDIACNVEEPDRQVVSSPWTLGEVLQTIYRGWGNRPNFNETEASRLEFEDILKLWRGRFGEDDGADWWKEDSPEFP